MNVQTTPVLGRSANTECGRYHLLVPTWLKLVCKSGGVASVVRALVTADSARPSAGPRPDIAFDCAPAAPVPVAWLSRRPQDRAGHRPSGGGAVNREVVERVRRAIYDTFASQGHPPSRQQVRDLAAVDEAQVNEAVAELAAQRHLALDQSGNVVMAHPFTTVNLGFSVMGERNLWWGGCAWDSFAIPNLVKDEPSVLVATTCPACRRPLAWTVTRAGPPEGQGLERRGLRVLEPAPLLFKGLRAGLARQHRPRTRLHHGSRHAVAPGVRLVQRTSRQPLSAQGPSGRRRLLPWRRPAGALLGAQRLTSCSVAAPLGLRHERICGPPPPTGALSAAEL